MSDKKSFVVAVALRRGVWAVVVPAVIVVAAQSADGVQPYTEQAIERGFVYEMQGFPQQAGQFGFGCGFVDLDNDGDQDIVILGAADNHVGIFENDGTGHFTDRSADSGIPPLPESSAFAAADYNGDGLIDMYFGQMGEPNVLVRNEGDFQFTDVSASAGVDDDGPSCAPNWGDFDNDGWLDLYVCNYNGQIPGTQDHDNKFYRNLGDGTFEEISVAQTVDSRGFSFQAVWFDYDRDGWLDLYISNDRGHLNDNIPNELYRNDNGQLVDVSKESGADVAIFSMGLACGDFDNNGYPDLYCTNIDSPDALGGINPLLLNQGDGTFVEAAAEAGVEQNVTSWGATFHDYDNNGWLDLYVNNMFEPNMMHVNYGAFPCTELAGKLGIQSSSSSPNVSYCAAVGDADGDGDLDLIVNNLSNFAQLFINNEGDNQNHVRLQLLGEGTNTHAVGGNVDVTVGAVQQYREIYAGGNGYFGQNETVLHVGLGSASSAEEVVVNWPSNGPTRTLTNLPANAQWTVYPPSHLGDADRDGEVDLDDFLVLADCFDQTIQPGCEMMDFDGNSTINMNDYNAFEDAFTGVVIDCNENDTADMQEILLEPSLDGDGDGLIDDCGTVPGDIDGSGFVDVSDLLLLLGSWGPCAGECPPTCEADLDADCTVNVSDLLILLANWG